MKQVVIMGAGPAGLAAGYELGRNGVQSTLCEADQQVGGISKTIQYKNYYFDLGGHRFFTKFKEVDQLWHEVLGDKFRKTPRISRIYYRNRFFNYPLTALNAFLGVGILNTFVILASYFKTKIFPYPQENTFEEWVSNRFGRKLYSIFFKTYTEKVWGIPCSQIQAEWAAQRIKGLSLKTAIINALFKPKNTNIKTLIDEFDYPVYGPGMMYTEMQNKIGAMGGNILLNSKVVKVNHHNFVVESIEYQDSERKIQVLTGTDFISSIPITELIQVLNPLPNPEVLAAAQNLKYRSIITIDVIINRTKLFPDNWIYIHSPEVKLGRIQNFKNWSSAMVPDANKSSLGLEYFCDENDSFWNMNDAELFKMAAAELERIKIAKANEIEDYKIVRVPKSYPVYMMGYKPNLNVISEYITQFKNLQLIGRYGLFKYNNMDHSIMTGLYAAKNIVHGNNLYNTWEINTDDEYLEESKQ
jgi:protoporphyrinogen oxidase